MISTPHEEFAALTADGSERNPNETIFPIVKQLEDDSWWLLGAGFFITKTGMFLTAKHVLTDVLTNDTNKQTHPIGAVLFSPENTYQFRRITKGFLNVPGDVAAGILANTDDTGKPIENAFHRLCRTPLMKGEDIHTYAFPKTVHAKDRINFRANYSKGKIEEYFPFGRDQTFLPNPCYQTNMEILSGASGAPVFNDAGDVVGINSTGIDCEPPHISYISSIEEAFNIIVEGIMLPCGYKEKCTIEELGRLGYINFIRDYSPEIMALFIALSLSQNMLQKA